MTYSAFAAGDRITADRLNAMVGQWTDYDPIWSATSGTTTLGDGTIVGRYCRVGNLVTFQARLSWGTTTTQSVSGANWTISLPTDVSNPRGGTMQPLSAWVLDASATFTRYVAAGYADNSTSPGGAVNIVPTGTNGIVDDITPMAWASGDRLNIWGQYEAV